MNRLNPAGVLSSIPAQQKEDVNMLRSYEHSILGNIAIKANRDERKAVAIICYDAGLEAQEIAKQMGLSTRTVNRYLESHIEITPEAVKTGLKVNLIEERKGCLLYRGNSQHYWVVRKLYQQENDPYAELERHNHKESAYLQVRIANLCKMATIARQ